MATILHITSLLEWEKARAIGLYRTDSLDKEGFIHFSTPEQAARVANDFYTGQIGLVLLVVDTDRLTAALKWEPPVHPSALPAKETQEGDLFPHLYGQLNLDAVVRVIDFPPDPEGRFKLPNITGQ